MSPQHIYIYISPRLPVSPQVSLWLPSTPDGAGVSLGGGAARVTLGCYAAASAESPLKGRRRDAPVELTLELADLRKSWRDLARSRPSSPELA